MNLIVQIIIKMKKIILTKKQEKVIAACKALKAAKKTITCRAIALKAKTSPEYARLCMIRFCK